MGMLKRFESVCVILGKMALYTSYSSSFSFSFSSST